MSKFGCYIVPVYCIPCHQFLPSNAQGMADDKMAASGTEGDNGTNIGITDAISLGNEGQERPAFHLTTQGHNAVTMSGTILSPLENIQRSMSSTAKIMQTLIAQKGGHKDNSRQSAVTS